MTEPKVVRYRPCPEDDGVMIESPTGGYVSWRRYSGLAARVQELEELLKWRASVASALRRPGGVFYVDVPARIKKLAARVQELEERNATICREHRVWENHELIAENTRLREALEMIAVNAKQGEFEGVFPREAIKEKP